MADLPKRLITGFMAFLFLLTTVGFTGFIIWEVSKQEKNNNTALDQQNTCGQVPTQAETLSKPEIYKTTNDIKNLEIKDLEVGAGQAVQQGDCINVKYYGSLANGKRFDDNFSDPTALQMPIGVGYVIPGWDQGLIGMKVDGTRRLVIPPSLGYGEKANGSIPANSTLVFIIKLVKIGEK